MILLSYLKKAQDSKLCLNSSYVTKASSLYKNICLFLRPRKDNNTAYNMIQLFGNKYPSAPFILGCKCTFIGRKYLILHLILAEKSTNILLPTREYKSRNINALINFMDMSLYFSHFNYCLSNIILFFLYCTVSP